MNEHTNGKAKTIYPINSSRRRGGIKPEDHWSCIAHLIAEDMLKSVVIEETKFKNIECK